VIGFRFVLQAVADGAKRPEMSDQKARMLRGDLYLASDPDLVAERERCRRLIEQFNAASATDPSNRRAILSELLGSYGPDSDILPPFRCDYGYQIHIGARSFLNYGVIVLDVAEVRIGDDVQIATGVQLLTATHPLEAAVRRAGWEYSEPISIGDGAWLGAGVIVCPGVTIGENTVVGAGSVVTRDLPDNVLAVGNPCRVVRKIDQTEDLVR
jgi:maltose O-acetyltransferase